MSDDFGGFSINLSLDEDRDWVAHLVELPSISAFGKAPEDAIKELRVAWDAFKEIRGNRTAEVMSIKEEEAALSVEKQKYQEWRAVLYDGLDIQETIKGIGGSMRDIWHKVDQLSGIVQSIRDGMSLNTQPHTFTFRIPDIEVKNEN